MQIVAKYVDFPKKRKDEFGFLSYSQVKHFLGESTVLSDLYVAIYISWNDFLTLNRKPHMKDCEKQNLSVCRFFYVVWRFQIEFWGYVVC